MRGSLRRKLDSNSNEHPLLNSVGYAVAALLLLKITAIVFCYGVWRRVVPHIRAWRDSQVPSDHRGEGDDIWDRLLGSDEQPEVHDDGRITYKGVLYARVVESPSDEDN